MVGLETLFAFLLGIPFGILTGLVPGVGVFVSLIILYPVLLLLEPTSILVLFTTILSLDQYFGSVSATLFAIPGSATSVPSVIEGHALLKKGQAADAIMYASLGSFFATIIAIIIIYLSLPILDLFYQLFNTNIQAVILVAASIITLFFSNNKFYSNVLLFLGGNILAYIGYRPEFRTTIGTFGIDFLYLGIPLIPVLVALFVFPNIVNSQKDIGYISFNKISFASYKNTLLKLKKDGLTLIRSSIIGTVIGFIPALTFVLATMVSYSLEKRLEEKAGRYKKGNLRALLAAESANNAGAYTSLIPLIFLGIPITGSAALVYSILENNREVISVDYFRSTFWSLTLAYLGSSIIGMFLAGKYVNMFTFLSKINLKYMYIAIYVLLFFVVFIAGYYAYAPLKYLLITICLLPLGYAIRKFDIMPLLFGFILHDISFNVFERLYYFYS